MSLLFTLSCSKFLASYALPLQAIENILKYIKEYKNAASNFKHNMK